MPLRLLQCSVIMYRYNGLSPVCTPAMGEDIKQLKPPVTWLFLEDTACLNSTMGIGIHYWQVSVAVYMSN